MTRNVGLLDRLVRLVLGIGLLALLLTGRHEWWGVFGVVPLLTAFAGICPLYAAAGIATRPDEPVQTDGRLLGL